MRLVRVRWLGQVLLGWAITGGSAITVRAAVCVPRRGLLMLVRVQLVLVLVRLGRAPWRLAGGRVAGSVTPTVGRDAAVGGTAAGRPVCLLVGLTAGRVVCFVQTLLATDGAALDRSRAHMDHSRRFLLVRVASLASMRLETRVGGASVLA